MRYLVKVGLQEVVLLLLLQQARPVLLAELLLLQHHLDIPLRVVDFGRGGVDLGVELELDCVLRLPGLGVAGEVNVCGLHV